MGCQAGNQKLWVQLPVVVQTLSKPLISPPVKLEDNGTFPPAQDVVRSSDTIVMGQVGTKDREMPGSWLRQRLFWGKAGEDGDLAPTAVVVDWMFSDPGQSLSCTPGTEAL